ncbi:transcriptional regulator with XRE-family HTH domain [Catenibacillus scindens]|uniref:Transcriptional regulator with XRE-family HTH domain n=1 Tax=Catenibacillus scindens TaxID=673271 RepID=A0A7W8M5A8_9FIRM|nr:helix-turn-helix transcriptional regulator [Catenibacillus scindens]MBB5264161.1 transcriptional regulator with XRE-family HTH domain [Catenibacillus scindens]
MQKLINTFDFGANLRRLRRRYELTQDQLVARLNLQGIDISRSKYSRYETGELNVPIDTIRTLQKIYQCPYEDFFDDEK